MSNSVIREQDVLNFVVESVRHLFDNHAITEKDDFFEQGGDSMLAIDFVAIVQERYKIKLDLVKLFENKIFLDLSKIVFEKIVNNQLVAE